MCVAQIDLDVASSGLGDRVRPSRCHTTHTHGRVCALGTHTLTQCFPPSFVPIRVRVQFYRHVFSRCSAQVVTQLAFLLEGTCGAELPEQCLGAHARRQLRCDVLCCVRDGQGMQAVSDARRAAVAVVCALSASAPCASGVAWLSKIGAQLAWPLPHAEASGGE